MSRSCRLVVCGGDKAAQQCEGRLLEGWIRVFCGKKKNKWCKLMTNSAWEVSLSLIIWPSTTHAQGCHKVTFFLNTSTSCTLLWVFSCPHFVQFFLIHFSGGNLLNKWGTDCCSFLLFFVYIFLAFYSHAVRTSKSY